MAALMSDLLQKHFNELSQKLRDMGLVMRRQLSAEEILESFREHAYQQRIDHERRLGRMYVDRICADLRRELGLRETKSLQ